MTVSSHHTEMNQSYAQTLYDMSHMGDMIATESPNIFCTTIPSHWRSNKSLPTNFRVFIFDEVKDGTIVTIRVGNDDNYSGELRNNTASVKDNVAQFNDLRFIGRSGRGKCFSLSVIVNTCPAMMTTLCKAIKITVDGPREPRNKTRQGWCTMPWIGPPLQGGVGGYGLALDPQHAALVDLYRAAQGTNLMDMYRLNQVHSLVNAGAAAHMLYAPVPSTVPSVHPHLPAAQPSGPVALEAQASVLQPPPPPPISALQYHHMAAALAGLSETQRAAILGLDGRCHRCSGCDSGLGPCLAMSKSSPSLPGLPSNASTTSTRSSNSASSSPPNTPSPMSRTSPSSTTTPKNETTRPQCLNSSSPASDQTSRLHPLFRSPSFLPTGANPLLYQPNFLPYRPPLKFSTSVPSLASSSDPPQSTTSNLSAFSIPKHSPRSVDSSRALQLAAVDSTNGSSPKSSSSLRACESSDAVRSTVSKINLERSRTSPASDTEAMDSGSRREARRDSPKFRSLKAPSSLSSSHCVWRPY